MHMIFNVADREMYSFCFAVAKFICLELIGSHSNTTQHMVEISLLKIRIGPSSRVASLDFALSLWIYLFPPFSRSPSNLIRSFGTVDAITTSPSVQHAPVSARNIHSWQMSRAGPRQACHLSTTGPDELRATTSMCYVSNNARKISVNYHYIGRYRPPMYVRTFDRKLMDKRRDRIQFHRQKFTCDSARVWER